MIKGELQLEMKKRDFDTWVENIKLVEVEEGKFVFETGNTYARDWLEKQLEEIMEEKLLPFVKGNGIKKAIVRFVCR